MVWATPFWRAKERLTGGRTAVRPPGRCRELDRLTADQQAPTVKELDLFSYVEFCLWNAVDDSSNFQRNFSTGEVEIEGSAIYHKTEYRERRNHYAVFWTNCPWTASTPPGCLLRRVRRKCRTGPVRAGHCGEQHCPRLGSGGPTISTSPWHRARAEHHLRAGLLRTRSGKIQRSGRHQQSPGQEA